MIFELNLGSVRKAERRIQVKVNLYVVILSEATGNRETEAKKQLFEKRFGVEKGTALLSEFLDEVYLPWSKANKKSWRNDAYRLLKFGADQSRL